MITLLSALVGFAVLDSLDVLLIGITAAIAYDARLRRTPPLKTGLAFIGGVFLATTSFGLLAVLGFDFLTGIVDFELTPTVRYWGELVLSVVLIALALLPQSDRPPPAWTAKFRRSPSLLAVTGFAVGIVQAPTAVPYLAGLAMLSSYSPLPPTWPMIVVAYCVLALIPPLVVLVMSMGSSRAARRRYRRVVRVLTKFGPAVVRIVFGIIGCALLLDVIVNRSYLW